MFASYILIIFVAISSLLAGMLGMGAGFIALPFMALFLPEFKSQGHQLVLLINAASAFVLFVFYRRLIDFKWKEILLLALTTLTASLLGVSIHHATIDQLCYSFFIYVYTLIIFFLVSGLFKDVFITAVNLKIVLVATFITALFAGWIGVGPGYMLLPLLITTGMDIKKSIGVSLFIEVFASITGLIPHLLVDTSSWNMDLAITMIVVSSLFAYIGLKLPRYNLLRKRPKLILSIVLVSLSIYVWINILGNCATVSQM